MAEGEREVVAANILGFKDCVTGSPKSDPIWVAAYGDWADACAKRKQDLIGNPFVFSQSALCDFQTRLFISSSPNKAPHSLVTKIHPGQTNEIKLLPIEPKLDTSKYEPHYRRLSHKDISESMADAKTLRQWCQKNLDTLCNSQNTSLESAKQFLEGNGTQIGQFKARPLVLNYELLSKEAHDWQTLSLYSPLSRLSATAKDGYITDRLPQLTERWQDAQDNADTAVSAISKLAYLGETKNANRQEQDMLIKTSIAAIDSLNHYIVDCDRIACNSRLDWGEDDYKQEAKRLEILKEREKWAEPFVKQQEALANAGVLYTISDEVQRISYDTASELYIGYGTHEKIHEKLVDLVAKCQEFEKAFSPEVREQMRKDSSSEGLVLSPEQKTKVANALAFYDDFAPQVVELRNLVSENLDGNWKSMLKGISRFNRNYMDRNYTRDSSCITLQAYLEGIDINIKMMKGPPK